MKLRLAAPIPLALLLLSACGHGPEGGGAPGTSTSNAKLPATASALLIKSAAPASTPSAVAPALSAGAASSADAEPAGPVRIHLETVKITSGKADAAEKTLKSNMLKLRTTCVDPALKKTPSFEGTLLVSLESGADGKIGKATAKAQTGKLPDDLLRCAEKFYTEKVQLEASAAKMDVTILVGPKVNADK